jgi:transposase InsO family protein
MVDDFSRKLFGYAMKNKRQEQVVPALRHHFLREATTPAGVNFYTDRAILRSDEGSEFVNASVQEFCDDMGCIQEFSCPGGGKW